VKECSSLVNVISGVPKEGDFRRYGWFVVARFRQV
jgi:hypothetical protein